ncbi:MAG: hypothetical protein ACFB50_04575 [Rubrobacteraceae bacterium]
MVLYDVDLTARWNEMLRPQQLIETLTPDQLDQYTIWLLGLMYGLQDSEEDLSLRAGQPGADRLGSVITTNSGAFSLTYDDAAFSIRDQEERPDLLVAVLAPDEGGANFASDNIVVPLGKPESERILHLSVFPIRNAGREEEIIIRIPQKTLNRFRIDQKLSTESFVSSIAGAERRRENVRASLTNRLDPGLKVRKRRELEEEATSFVNRLSAVPTRLRETELFVGSGEDPSSAIHRARESGIARITPHSDPRITAAHLRFSDDELQRFGVTDLASFKERLQRGETIEVPLDPSSFCQTLQEKIGGTELAEVTRLLDEQREAAQERLGDLNDDTGDEPPPTNGEGDNENGSEDSTEEELSAEERVKQLVLAQVETMAPEDDLEKEESQVERIRDALETLRPPASPADVTTFHDFSHLQIAFPDVWAEAFNRDVRDLVRSLHIEYRDYDAEHGVDDSTSIFGTDGIDPDELEDLKDYTDLMGKLVGDISSADQRAMPDNVRRLISEARSLSGSGAPMVRVNGGGAVVAPGGGRRRTAKVSTPEASGNDIETLWNSLSIEQQEMLIQLANDQVLEEQTVQSDEVIPEDFKTKIFDLLGDSGTGKVEAAVQLLREVRRPPETKLAPIDPIEKKRRALEIISNPEGRVTRVQRLMAELAQRLSEPHSFRVFQKDSINFGIVTTYRQEWKPGTYQTGSLVGTLPLAPGETRKYSKKQVTKKSRAEKENEKYASTLSDERTIISRAVADIVEKANTATNFEQSVSANLSGTIGVFTVGANSSSQFQRNQSVESQRIKKTFREAVRKASQEYKNERSVEISTEDIGEFETTGTSEISNPNNEITVSYLFYELERQYTVSEHLHRLTPVILVAQEVPNPGDIDEDFILAHEPELRRCVSEVLFHDAFDYIRENLVSDEVTLEVAREHYETQKALVEDLTTTVESLSTLQETLRDSLIQTSEQEKLARASQSRAARRRRRGRLRAAFGLGPPPSLSSRIASGASSLAFGNRNDDPEVLEARREALETRLEFLEGTLEDSRSELTRATSVLEKATDDLTGTIQKSFTHRNLVNQLRIRIKDDILTCMQAVWSNENPAQRFFRLYDLPVQVPVPEAPTGDSSPALPRFTFTPPASNLGDGPFPGIPPLTIEDLLNVRVTLPAPGVTFEERRLHEIADLDTLLGFKGNYMIFPLKECAYITDYMMQDYVDDYFGIRDPDPVAGFTTEELLTHAEKVWHDEETTNETRETLNALVRQRLASPRLEDERIVVTTGQLFIEALKGEHTLLEHFKEQHRGMDVLKVNEEVQEARLENLRFAARLVADEPRLDDPEVDKRVEIEGAASVDIDAD